MKKQYVYSLIVATGIAAAFPNSAPYAAETDVYVKAKTAYIYEQADQESEILCQAEFGEKLELSVSNDGQTAEDNKPTRENKTKEDSPEEWTSVVYTESDGNEIEGYIKNSDISEENVMIDIEETAIAASDGEIYDYPGRRDGEVIGELLEYDEVERIAEVGDTWSRIIYLDEDFEEAEGYILTTLLEGYEPTPTQSPTETPEAEETSEDKESNDQESDEEEEKEAMISEGAGEGIFAEAEEGVTAQGIVDENGVLVGSPVGVSGDVYLKPMGTFRITHYCQCSICCGPYANGITATGVTAVTNHTIAVQPGQIPYGSKVVVNGQVYVAEDCGGGIKTNCIDIYVASHAEALAKGVYYTDVYLLVNG